MNKKSKDNIDAVTALIENGLATDPDHARSLLNCSLVFVGDKCIKAGSKISNSDISTKGLRVKYSKPYVSRGAEKLLSVFKNIDLNVKGFRCMDVGSSTGGFTQLLLEKGASFVHAVDVGKGIIDSKLRNDQRVLVIEGVNARSLNDHEIVRKNIDAGSLDLAVFDLSFISLKLVVPVVSHYIKADGWLVTLVKPQFEVARELVEEGGVVRDEGVIKTLLDDMTAFFLSTGLTILKIIPSDLKGPSGNQEYFYVMRKR